MVDYTDKPTRTYSCCRKYSVPSIVFYDCLNSGFQKLLTNMIRTEAASLPRGLAHTVSRGTSSHDRNMQSIPEFLTSQYDKSKSPGLNQGLAGKSSDKIKTSAEKIFGILKDKFLHLC